MPRTSLAVIAPLCCACAALAQPLNDHWQDAVAVNGLGTPFAFDSTGADIDGPAPCGALGSDVWFCWTADAAGFVAATTCALAGHDTVLSVYAGCGDPAAATNLACNDDAFALQSRASFTAQAGQSYLIQVAGFAGAMGAGSLQIDPVLPLTGPVVHPDTGRRYFLYPPTTWTAGEALAVALGGHLATIRNADENTWVRDAVLSFDARDRRGWIGLNDAANEGEFVWTSGEPVTFTNWNAGEPNNAGGNEHFTELLSSNAAWNDQPDGGNGLGQHPIIELAPQGPSCVADVDDGSGTGTPDMAVTIDDLLYYLGLFEAGDVRADVDDGTGTNTRDGAVTIDDLLYYLQRFEAGC